MTLEWWLSIGLGLSLGLLYGLASYWTWKQAERYRSTRSFLVILLGGMVARMIAALALVVLVVALLPAREVVFVASFFVVFLIWLVVEIIMVQRTQASRLEP